MSTLKPYFVNIETTAVVMAEDEGHAQEVANMRKRDIFSDCEIHFSQGFEINSEAELIPHGWDGLCIPYGGDGNTRLKDILAALESLPARDKKTLDMFDDKASGN